MQPDGRQATSHLSLSCSSHPSPRAFLVAQALETSDFALGTRYGEGFAVDKDWPWYRIIISKGGRLLARPLTPLSDPMSGFFGITKAAFAKGKVQNTPAHPCYKTHPRPPC